MLAQQPLIEKLEAKIEQVATLYHRLVLVVGPTGSGKTTLLRTVAQQNKIPIINVNLTLSHTLLELREKLRALRVSELLEDIVEEAGPIVLLDTIELLFQPSLQLKPLESLQKLSRHRTIVAAWNGRLEGNILVYAEVDHAEYHRYPTDGLVLLQL